jgi:hypothetical protein
MSRDGLYVRGGAVCEGADKERRPIKLTGGCFFSLSELSQKMPYKIVWSFCVASPGAVLEP